MPWPARSRPEPAQTRPPAQTHWALELVPVNPYRRPRAAAAAALSFASLVLVQLLDAHSNLTVDVDQLSTADLAPGDAQHDRLGDALRRFDDVAGPHARPIARAHG